MARKLCQAASQVGFLYVTNHGVDEKTLVRARNAGFKFFRLTGEEKLAASSNEHHHGYLKPGSSRMYDDAELDLKRELQLGNRNRAGSTRRHGWQSPDRPQSLAAVYAGSKKRRLPVLRRSE